MIVLPGFATLVIVYFESCSKLLFSLSPHRYQIPLPEPDRRQAHNPLENAVEVAGAVITHHGRDLGRAEIRGNQEVLSLAHPAAYDILNWRGAGDFLEHMGRVIGRNLQLLSHALQRQGFGKVGGDILADPVDQHHGFRLRLVPVVGGETQGQRQKRQEQMLSDVSALGGPQLHLIVHQLAQVFDLLVHPPHRPDVAVLGLGKTAGRQPFQLQPLNAEADGADLPVGGGLDLMKIPLIAEQEIPGINGIAAPVQDVAALSHIDKNQLTYVVVRVQDTVDFRVGRPL